MKEVLLALLHGGGAHDAGVAGAAAALTTGVPARLAAQVPVTEAIRYE
jgi:hypothetical protein